MTTTTTRSAAPGDHGNAGDTTKPTPPKRGGGGGPAFPKAFYLMVLPALLLFFVFHTIPVLQGIYYSFTDSPGYGPHAFVGLRNYIALFTDPRVIHAYWFTFLIAGVATVLVNIVALAIAVGLNSRIKFKTALRGVYFVPNILAILVIGYIFNYLFSNSLPALGEKLGIEALASSMLTEAEHRLGRHRHPGRLAGGGVQHHHLHRRAADRSGRGLRGRRHRRRIGLAPVPQHHVPTDRRRSSRSTWCCRSRDSCRSSTTSSR